MYKNCANKTTVKAYKIAHKNFFNILYSFNIYSQYRIEDKNSRTLFPVLNVETSHVDKIRK